MTDRDTDLTAITAFVRHLRRRLVLVEVAAASAAGAALLLILGLLVVCAEHLLYMSPGWRLALEAAALAAVAALVGVRSSGRLRGRLSGRDLCLRAERCHPLLGERLVSAIELGHDERLQRLYSPSLLTAAVRSAAEFCRRCSPSSIVSWRDATGPLRRLAAVAALVAAVILAAGSELRPAATRVLHPLAHYERPARTLVQVMPPQLEVVKGDDAAVEIVFRGEVPRTAEIRSRDRAESARVGEAETVQSEWHVAEVVVVDGRADVGGAADGDTLRYTFKDVRRPFDFTVHGGDADSGPHGVAVIDPPEVQQLTVAYGYPEYTGLFDRVESENGDISAIAGSRIELRIDASKPLAAAAIVVDDTIRLEADVSDRQALLGFALPLGDRADSLSADGLVLRHDYWVSLRDRKGIHNRDPIRYTIEVLPDAFPRVRITEPGENVDLPESQQIFLGIEASDDFGIAALDLLFRREGSEDDELLALPLQAAAHVRSDYAWDLLDLDLLPEERVLYRVRASDNDAVGGPKWAFSQEFALRFPSLYELLDEVSQQQEETVASLEELAERQRDTREYLGTVRRELLKSEELSWEQKRELEAALDRERERAQALEDVSRELAATADKLAAQGLSSEDLVDKMAEIRELMEAVASPELLEALRELQKSVDQFDPQQLAEALEEFAEQHELFEERLERTLELLRQVRAEQLLEAAVAQARDLLERQTEIDEALAASDAAPERLGEREGDVARDAERMLRDLEATSEAMAPLSQQSSASLSEMAERMSEQRLSGRMDEMAERLKQQQLQNAQRLGSGLEEDLGVLVSDLEHLQGSYAAEAKSELSEKLRRSMNDLLAISQRQEDLARRTAQLGGSAPAHLADEQQALLRGTDQVIVQLSSVAQRTLSLSPAVAVSVGYARKRMTTAGQRLGQREAKASLTMQREAVRYLNESIDLLRESVDSISNSFMPSGFAEAMEKMMGLSQQQAALNRATQEAMGANPSGERGGGGGDLRSEMARLAAEQQRLQKAMSELERGLRGHRGAEKRLERIGDDMESALRDMKQRQPPPRLHQTQERILQRMLDASRSIYSRGFQKKRRSESGAGRAYAGPAWLRGDLGQQRDDWRNAMKSALAGDLPPEYRELVRRYYELVYEDMSALPADRGDMP